MKNPDLKFNKPFRSDEQMLPEISLQYRLDTADAISKSLADSEIIAHTYKVKVQALKELLAHEKFSLEVETDIKFLIDKVEKRLSLYKERKELILLKQETKTTYEPLDKNESWKKDTPLEFLNREKTIETNLYTMVQAKDNTRVKALDDQIDDVDAQIEYTYDHMHEIFPKEFEKIEQKFKDMQRENRTN